MPQKRGDTRLRFWQMRPASVPALYSSPLASLRTAKLMVVGCEATCSSANSRVSSG